MATQVTKKGTTRELGVATGLALVAVLAFYFSTKPMFQYFDYTGRIALALLHGHLGLESHPSGWLYEMIPLQGKILRSLFPWTLLRSMRGMAI